MSITSTLSGTVTALVLLYPLAGGAGVPVIDLTTVIEVDPHAVPGQNLGSSLRATVRNSGSGTAPGALTTPNGGGFVIDIVLSKDQAVPPGWKVPSETFHEDVLLWAGRISTTTDLPANGEKTYMNSELRLPAKVAPGPYFVCSLVDSGQKVVESNEANNVGCSPLNIIGPGARQTPSKGGPTPEKKVLPNLRLGEVIRVGASVKTVKAPLAGRPLVLTRKDFRQCWVNQHVDYDNCWNVSGSAQCGTVRCSIVVAYDASNTGSAQAGPSQSHLAYDDFTFTWNEPALAAGATQTRSVVVDLPEPYCLGMAGSPTLRIRLDEGNGIQETFEDDNVGDVKLQLPACFDPFLPEMGEH